MPAKYGCGFFDAFQLLNPAARHSLIATRESTLATIRARAEHYGLELGATADVSP